METLSLLATIYQNGDNLHDQVVASIARGEDLDRVTEYSESALRVASNNGRFDVIKLLLDSGADEVQLEWSEVHFAVAFGSTGDLRKSVTANENDLEARDFWSRTPFLLAILTGDRQKTSALLDLGADRNAVGRRGKTAYQYAIQNDDVPMLDWLKNNECDLDVVDEFDTTPLIAASEAGKTKSVRYLIDQGVDIFRRNHIPQRAIEVASNLEIVELLVRHGDDLNDISEEMHKALTRTGGIESPTVSRDVYLREKHREFGKTNPEEVHKPLWIDMIQSGATAWRARDTYGDSEGKGPVWSYERFGRTTNILPDGRIIEIAGEHEDHYDPDFCIYNDIVVFEPNNTVRIFSYPEAQFPPTDFHTANLVGDDIFIIGCLGYPDSRKVGHTPVYKLDIQTMRLSEVATSGEPPGWISDHKTLLSDKSLIVTGGEVWIETNDGVDLASNSRTYALDLDSCTWNKLE